jgi:hypothetical protein
VSQKTGFAKFSTIIGAYAVIYLISIIITAVTGSTVIIWLPMIFAFLCQLALRLYVVRKENIMDCGSSPLIGEFCCGFWCWYCSVAQSKKHFLNTKVYVLLIIIFRFVFFQPYRMMDINKCQWPVIFTVTRRCSMGMVTRTDQMAIHLPKCNWFYRRTTTPFLNDIYSNCERNFESLIYACCRSLLRKV